MIISILNICEVLEILNQIIIDVSNDLIKLIDVLIIDFLSRNRISIKQAAYL